MVEERTLELLLANEKLQKEIVERKKITDHLFVSQERFRKIFESSPSLMAIYSLKNGTYIDVNTSWINFTGYGYDELLKQKINLHDFIEEANGHAIQLEQPIRNMKIRYKTKSGEMRTGLLSSELIDIEPEPCILFVLTDITERVLFEKEIITVRSIKFNWRDGCGNCSRNSKSNDNGLWFFTSSKGKSQLSNEIIDLMLDELNRANSIITEFLNLAKNKVSDKKMQNLNTIIEALFPLIQAEAMRASKQVVLQLSQCSRYICR